MPDLIIGTAILAREDGKETLFFFRQREGDQPVEDALPVRPKGTPNPDNLCWWEYVEKGDVLECSPSVRVSTTRPSKTEPNKNEVIELFHNQGQWSVKFKLADGSGLLWKQLRAENGVKG